MARDRVAEREEHRIVDRRRILRAGDELRVPRRQAGEAPRVRALVGDVVRAPREGVDGGEVAPQRAGEQPRADREVLVMAARDAQTVRVRGGECARIDPVVPADGHTGGHAASAPGRP